MSERLFETGTMPDMRFAGRRPSFRDWVHLFTFLAAVGSVTTLLVKGAFTRAGQILLVLLLLALAALVTSVMYSRRALLLSRLSEWAIGAGQPATGNDSWSSTGSLPAVRDDHPVLHIGRPIPADFRGPSEATKDGVALVALLLGGLTFLFALFAAWPAKASLAGALPTTGQSAPSPTTAGSISTTGATPSAAISTIGTAPSTSASTSIATTTTSGTTTTVSPTSTSRPPAPTPAALPPTSAPLQTKAIPNEAYTMGQYCGLGNPKVRNSTKLTLPYCTFQPGYTAGDRDSELTMDVNITTGSKRMSGVIVLDDGTVPVEAIGFVKLLTDATAVQQGEITFASPYTFDLDVSGKSRVTLRFSIPERARGTLNLARLVLTEATFTT